MATIDKAGNHGWYGDPDEIAGRVKENLLDLLPITQRSIALPLPSYSLKVVEKYVGFKRELEDVAGDWAMAKYIEAVETEDTAKRDGVMNEILDYNREDLEATWAVLKWLKSKSV
jgi:predicted RecB family nuclease